MKKGGGAPGAKYKIPCPPKPCQRVNENSCFMKCKSCGTLNHEDSNFCINCGIKLRDKCNCWVKKQDSYDCGESNCPGYGLFKLEKFKAQVIS